MTKHSRFIFHVPARNLAALLIGIALLGLQSSAQASQSPTRVDFVAAGTRGKVAILARIAEAREAIDPTASAEILDDALVSSESEVRLAGLGAIGRQSFEARQRPGAGRANALALSTAVVNRTRDLMRDPDPKVRLAAIIAAGNIDMLSHSDNMGRPTVSDSLLAELGGAYEVELDGRVRTEIIKAFALLPPGKDNRQARQLFEAALDDAEPQVLQYAALGIASYRLQPLLARLSVLLQSDSRIVRTAAGQAIGAFGPSAAGQLDDVEAALARETDDVARRTLEGALAAIRKR